MSWRHPSHKTRARNFNHISPADHRREKHVSRRVMGRRAKEENYGHAPWSYARVYPHVLGPKEARTTRQKGWQPQKRESIRALQWGYRSHWLLEGIRMGSGAFQSPQLVYIEYLEYILIDRFKGPQNGDCST
jgi:hypothetical protein